MQEHFGALRRLTIGLVALSMAAAGTASASPDATPIALFDGSQLVACGVSLSGVADGASFETELTLRRRGALTSFRIVARWGGDGAKKPVLDEVVLATRTQSTAHRLAPINAPPTWDVAAEGAIAGIDGGVLMQELMVSGGHISLRTSPTRQAVANIAGPLPQLVRASYLNCAGDLFRPEN